MAPDREHELRKAVKQATSLPSRDFRVYSALLDRADWKSAVIPNRFQPRNLDDLAAESGLGVRTVLRSLDHLAMHGWVLRTKGSAPGRHGRAVAYVLDHGEPCCCKPEKPAPMTGAERARLFRERRKQRQIGVTDEGISRHFGVAYNATRCYEDAGQDAFRADEGRDEGKREEGSWLGGHVSNSGWPEGSYGEQVNDEDQEAG